MLDILKKDMTIYQYEAGENKELKHLFIVTVVKNAVYLHAILPSRKCTFSNNNDNIFLTELKHLFEEHAILNMLRMLYLSNALKIYI